MVEHEDMGLALQNHQLEADNERLTGQNAALREKNHELDQRCVDLYRQLTQVTAERDTLVADLRQRQAGQKSAEEQLAKAREEVEFLHVVIDDRVAERDDLRAENTAMRALLERATNDDSPLLAVIVPNAESIAALALLQEMRNLLDKS